MRRSDTWYYRPHTRPPDEPAVVDDGSFGLIVRTRPSRRLIATAALTAVIGAVTADLSAGPSDPDGQFTYDLSARHPAHAARPGPPSRVVLPPDEPVAADETTEWITPHRPPTVSQVRPGPVVRLVRPWGGAARGRRLTWFTPRIASLIQPRAPIRPGATGLETLDLGAGPSDGDGQQTFGFVVPRRTILPRPVLPSRVIGAETADLSVGPDESTEWIPTSTRPRIVLPVVPSQVRSEATHDLSAGPSDPDGQHTFGFVVPRRTVLPRPVLPSRVAGTESLDLSAGPDETTEWLPTSRRPRIVLPVVPSQVRSEATLELSAGPSDPDGQQTFGFDVRTSRVTRALPGRAVVTEAPDEPAAVDETTDWLPAHQAPRLRRPDGRLTVTEAPDEPVDTSTEWITPHRAPVLVQRPGRSAVVAPDDEALGADAIPGRRLTRRPVVPSRETGAVTSDLSAGPSDPDGQQTYGFVVRRVMPDPRPLPGLTRIAPTDLDTLGPDPASLPDALFTRARSATRMTRARSATRMTRARPVERT